VTDTPRAAPSTTTPASAPTHRDVVVIGGSAGAIEALRALLGALPRDLPAAVFVVLHQAAEHRTRLPELLTRVGPLPVELAVHGQPIRPGHVVLAPPDNHLLLAPGYVSVVRGPKENGHRPAIDPLFRSAANAFGPRVIGVVLSGALDCGTYGLSSIKARGGLTLVQDPAEAQVTSMPESALAKVAIDQVGRAAALGAFIGRTVREPLPAAEATSAPDDPPATREVRADVSCPLCQGAMTEAGKGADLVLRCHVGHQFSLAGLLQVQSEALESALWAGVRALEESARIARRAAATTPGVSRQLVERARVHEHDADVIRRMRLNDPWPPPELLPGSASPPGDVP
jgi:two-component system chemotaxis response regulator CheB